CASAYNVCWSLWPAWVVFFGATSCLCLYHLLTSRSIPIMFISSIIAGLSIPGAIMLIYPPWLVSTGYLFGLILIGLLARKRMTDRAGEIDTQASTQGETPEEYTSIGVQDHAECRLRRARMRRGRTIAIVVLIALAGGLILSFVWACWPSFRVMGDTV